MAEMSYLNGYEVVDKYARENSIPYVINIDIANLLIYSDDERFNFSYGITKYDSDTSNYGRLQYGYYIEDNEYKSLVSHIESLSPGTLHAKIYGIRLSSETSCFGIDKSGDILYFLTCEVVNGYPVSFIYKFRSPSSGANEK